MKYKRTLIITILIAFAFSPINAQKVEGILLSQIDTTAIEASHIVNISNQEMTTSDHKGIFSLIIRPGDTIIVSNINYITKQLIMADQAKIIIFMEPQHIQLDEVVVSNMPKTAHDFKRLIIEMENQETKPMKIEGLLPIKEKGPIPKNYDPAYNNSIKYAVNKPISFIAKKLSKSYKEKAKYYAIAAKKGRTITNDKKFNRELVQQLTQLEGDQLSTFMSFMDVDPAYIARSSEYEIALHIQSKFRLFQSIYENDSTNVANDNNG